MVSGGSFETALATRSFEPDAPNFTPRISGIVTLKDKSFSYKLSILKSLGTPSGCARFFFDYDTPVNGLGHFIHTYEHDGKPLPTFSGEPTRVEIKDDIDDFANEIWNSLNGDNKISLYVKYVDLVTGEADSRLFNKHSK
jgi:hypothetical protein